MDDVTDIEDVDTITVDTEMRTVSTLGTTIAEQALKATKEGDGAAPATGQPTASAEGVGAGGG
eukprot:1577542-Rhodomonas_salina.1